MEKKQCGSCGETKWHNPTTDKYPGGRCTYCGSPVSNNPGKREAQQAIQRKQVAKLGRLV